MVTYVTSRTLHILSLYHNNKSETSRTHMQKNLYDYKKIIIETEVKDRIRLRKWPVCSEMNINNTGTCILIISKFYNL